MSSSLIFEHLRILRMLFQVLKRFNFAVFLFCLIFIIPSNIDLKQTVDNQQMDEIEIKYLDTQA